MSGHSISIVMPFRNAAATLPECIESIRAQTFRDFEVVAIDDRSSDESAGSQPAGLVAARAPLIARMDARAIANMPAGRTAS